MFSWLRRKTGDRDDGPPSREAIAAIVACGIPREVACRLRRRCVLVVPSGVLITRDPVLLL